MMRRRVVHDVARERLVLRQKRVAQDVEGNRGLHRQVVVARLESLEMEIHLRPIEQRPLLHVHVVEDLHLEVDARLVVEHAENIEAPLLLVLRRRDEFGVAKRQVDERVFPRAPEHVVDERQRHVLSLLAAEHKFKD